MKTIKDYILHEKLVLRKGLKGTEYAKFPESKSELIDMIRYELRNNGLQTSLNHIDVSKITDMSNLFSNGYYGYGLERFNGDISEWDVSSVKNMNEMFYESSFTGKNGDISEWKVSNVTDMNRMFYNSKFKGDLSKWEINENCDCRNILDMIDDFPEEYLPVVPEQWDKYIAHLRKK
jgi:hypothetical protein